METTMIKAEGKWLKDEHGRTLLLRGVNLGGSSKVPRIPDGATHIREGFFDHRDVSFVGRPFPLDQAGVHLARIRSWGFQYLRLLVTWEAIEHAGPGLYDQRYLDYLAYVVEMAADYGLGVIIDPHQDVWSRFSGGDGAPGWTFELAGMDIHHFHQTGAALVHQSHGDPLPPMSWPTNVNRFACATMFTLFFGGERFAPGTMVDGVSIQEYLQAHFIGAMAQVARRLRRMPNVVGYETMNEPTRGYIGVRDLDGYVAPTLAFGVCPTVFEGMLLAAGYPQEVEERPMVPHPLARRGVTLLNPQEFSLWLNGCEPIWRRHGVWEMGPDGQPKVLRPDYFSRAAGRAVVFDRDYFYPFVERYVRALRPLAPDAVFFVGPPPSVFGGSQGDHAALICGHNLVHAPHWYDHLTLGLQRYISWLGLDIHNGKPRWVVGRERVRRHFVQQVRRLVEQSCGLADGLPTVIGETGVPFNLNGGEALQSGDYAAHIDAMDDTMQALEANVASFLLWNYTADNGNLRGDQWNGEDFSIFSPAQQRGNGDLNDGGRALEAIVRPHAQKVAGEPLAMSFDIKTKQFSFAFRPDPSLNVPTEFFVPRYQYPYSYRVTVTDGIYQKDVQNQRLTYWAQAGQEEHRVLVEPV
jgi:hypothetical protein